MNARIITKEINRWCSGEGVTWLETWLLVDEKPVSYVKLVEKPDYKGTMCICTIETRKEFRRQGYSSLMLDMVAKEQDKALATNASFTPEGFAALGSRPVLPGYEPATKANWEAMDFVRDWDTMVGP